MAADTNRSRRGLVWTAYQQDTTRSLRPLAVASVSVAGTLDFARWNEPVFFQPPQQLRPLVPKRSVWRAPQPVAGNHLLAGELPQFGTTDFQVPSCFCTREDFFFSSHIPSPLFLGLPRLEDPEHHTKKIVVDCLRVRVHP